MTITMADLAGRMPQPPVRRRRAAHRLRPSAARQGRFVAPTLAVFAVSLWLIGIEPVSPEQLGSYGLIAALSPLVLLAYPVLVAAMAAELLRARPRAWLLGLLTVLAVLGVYGLQPAVQEVARLPIAWLHAGFADYIGDTGKVLSDFDTRFSWPGFFAVAAFAVKASGQQDATVLLQWAPVVLGGLATLGVRALAGAVLGSGRAGWLATWIFLLGNWTEQDYFSPQGTTMILLVAALAITVRYLVRPGLAEGGRSRLRERPVPANAPGTRIFAQFLVLLLATALAPTHQLTPFVLVGLLGVLLIWGRLWSGWLPFAALVPALLWFALAAKEFWVGQLDLITGSIGNVGSSVGQGIGARLAGDPGRLFIVGGRIGLTVVIGLLAMAGLLVLRKRGVRTWVLAALAVAPFGLAVLQPYGGEVFLRSYLFALPWLAIGAGVALGSIVDAAADRLRSRAADGRWRSVGRSLLLVGPAWLVVSLVGLTTVATRGGNDAYTSFTRADVAAVREVYALAKPGQRLLALTWYSPLRLGRLGDLSQLAADDVCGSKDLEKCLREQRPDFVIVSPEQENYGRIVAGRPAGWADRIVQTMIDQDGYRVVFDRDGRRVLTLEAGPVGKGAA